MTNRNNVRSGLRIVAAAVCVAGLVAGTAPLASAAPYRTPLATGLANPGVIYDQVNQRWVIHTTGGRAAHHVATAKSLTGKFTISTKKLLTKNPKWSNGAKGSIWAPSVAKSTDGTTYVVYYSGIVKGSATRRCIGTGTSTNAKGPFKPQDRPLACWTSNPRDKVKSEGTGFSLIDPTPAQVSEGLVLTYKTQIRKPRRPGSSKQWHTTTRILKLDPAHPQRVLANPVHADGRSVRITNKWSKYIEENPVIVQTAGGYALFTSWGWYGTCRYSTQYRLHSDLWSGWPAKATQLAFPKNRNTCGTGNAQVVLSPTGQWRIFFNGHPDQATKGGPDGLYVGRMTWTGGKPRVTSLVKA